MGICYISNKKEVLKAENVNCNIIKKEDAFNGDPILVNETEELLLYKPAIFKINFRKWWNKGKNRNRIFL